MDPQSTGYEKYWKMQETNDKIILKQKYQISVSNTYVQIYGKGNWRRNR